MIVQTALTSQLSFLLVCVYRLSDPEGLISPIPTQIRLHQLEKKCCTVSRPTQSNVTPDSVKVDPGVASERGALLGLVKVRQWGVSRSPS